MNDIERFKYSLSNALAGIRTTLRTQRNIRIHIIISLLIIAISVILQLSAVEFAVILLTILIVFVAEILNTAIEFTIDLVSPQFDHAAKKAKDVSAAAVLISAFFAVLIGLIILAPKILSAIFPDL